MQVEQTEIELEPVYSVSTLQRESDCQAIVPVPNIFLSTLNTESKQGKKIIIQLSNKYVMNNAIMLIGHLFKDFYTFYSKPADKG